MIINIINITNYILKYSFLIFFVKFTFSFLKSISYFSVTFIKLFFYRRNDETLDIMENVRAWNGKQHWIERDLSLGSTTSNLWILSVAIGFMEIQCLNWKIIGQCLGAEHSARNPLLNEYNHPLTDIRLSQPIFPVSRRVDNPPDQWANIVRRRDLTKLLSPAAERRLIFKLRLESSRY